MSKNISSQRLAIAACELSVAPDGNGCFARMGGSKGAPVAEPLPLLVLEVYERTLMRTDQVQRLQVIRLERAEDALHVVMSDRGRGITLGAWVRGLADGGVSVTVSPAEVYETKPELFRLMNINVLPGLMHCGAEGQILLPVNTGVVFSPGGKPARSARFLIYGQQSCWELLPTMPACAAQGRAGGWVALAAGGAPETECHVSTDGQGHGQVGFSMFWREHGHSPVEQENRVIRFHPIPAGKDITVFTAGLLRQHITAELGKPTLTQRASESPQVAHLLGAYIMKLFYGVQVQGGVDGENDWSRFCTTMTFDEAGAALEQLHKAGVDRIYTQNVGWNYRGHDGAYPTRFPVEERAGGEAAFRKLIADRHAAGDAMTVHDNYLDAYTISTDFDPEVMTVDAFGQMQIRGFWAGKPSFLAWPSAFADRHLADQMKRVKELGVRGPYYLDGMGSPLYANYHPRHRGSRSELARGIDRLLRTARDLYGSSATETGYLYCSITPDLVANPGGQHLVSQCRADWPVTDLLEQIVPLWQLTMSGLVVTENQGLSWTETMTALLLNQHPRYEWSTRPGVHPVLDRPMIAKINARFDLLIKRFGYLREQRLVDFTRDGSLEQTVFEDGTRVAADFASGELVVNDERIDPPAALVEPKVSHATAAVAT